MKTTPYSVRLALSLTSGFVVLLCLPALLFAQVPPPNGPGNALSFDGVNDRLTATPATLPAGNSSYTIEAWINTTAMNAGTIAAWGNFGTANQVNAFRLTPTGLVNYWWANDLSVTTPSLVGAWHHVAATFDGTTRRMLVDGVVVGSDTPLGHNAGTGNFSIGAANNGEFFSGQMDEVRIWSVGRTAAQIQEAMRRQLWGNESGLVACYRLDEGTGLSAFDATGNPANTAMIENGPAWGASTIVPFAPSVGLATASAVTLTGATLNGSASPNLAVTTGYFQWGLTMNYGNVTPAQDLGNAPNSWASALSGLTPGVTYHFRAVATNVNGASFSEDQSLCLTNARVVLNLNDSGPGSLRDAIACLVPGGTITFAPNVTNTIVLTSGELLISKDLTLQGPGAKLLTISGNYASRVLQVSNGTVHISDLTIANGHQFGDANILTRRGGGIYNRDGVLTLSNCLITANGVFGPRGADGISGGALDGTAGQSAFGGGVYNGNQLTVINCAFSANRAAGGSGGHGAGGAVPTGGNGGNGGFAWGGAIYNFNTCFIYNSSFHTNYAIAGSGGNGANGTTTGGNAGNGGQASGGAISQNSMTLPCQLHGATVVGNLALGGRAGARGLPNGVAGNPVQGYGGGLNRTFNAQTPSVRNSIIALNIASTDGRDVYSTITSLGHNLIGVTDGSTGWTPTDLTGTAATPRDPRLLPFADHGGPTFTFALCADSPALDAGDGSLITTSTDQRGFARVAGTHTDIGAFELQTNEFTTIVVQNRHDDGPGSLRDALRCIVPGGTITIPSFLSGFPLLLTSGELLVDKSVNILGADPRSLIVSGSNVSRVFNVTAGNVFITGITIRDGQHASGPVSQGGGVFNQGNLTFSNCLFTANAARGVNGAYGTLPTRTGGTGTPAYGGGIFNTGRLTLVACSFSLNEARGGHGGNGQNGGNAGGQAGHGGAAGGGAVWNENVLDVFNCTFSTNGVFGGNGGDGGLGAVFDGNGGNGGDADGGAIVGRSGGVYLEHVTVVGNEATRGTAGAGDTAGVSGLANGGGLNEWPASGSVILRNSLVALNHSVDHFTSGPSDVSGDLQSSGHNLIGVTNLSSTAWRTDDLVGSLAVPLDAKLGAYGLNLGYTPNYALQPTSPAVDAGDDNSLQQLITDQRGFPRRASAHVDIGAYELCRDVPAFVVTTLADHSPGSLRAALECLAPGGTITFAPGLAGVIHIGLGEGFVLDRDLTLIGPGADRLRIQTTNSRIFRVTAGRVHISGLTLTGGDFGGRGADAINLGENGGAGSDGEGGGILNFGDLTVSDCMFRQCVALGGDGGTGGPNFGILAPGAGGRGGAARGGGVCNRGRLTLLRCTFINNFAFAGWGGQGGEDGHIGSTPGGAGGLGGAALGGGLYNAGILFATNCTIVTNQVVGGDGGNGGFGIPSGGNGGNGGSGFGAGFYDEGTATIVSCTFTVNRALEGFFGFGGVGSSSTGADGQDGLAAAGGIFSDSVLPFAYVRNSLTAGNVAANGSDVLGGVVSGGFNFVGTFNDGAFVTLNPFTEPTDIVGEWPTILDPRFGRLDYHGGTTLTLALLFDSPALDQGHASGTAADQRGVGRPADQPAIANATGGDGSDIGAYEMAGVPNLSIRLGAPSGGFNNVILSWPNPSTGYVLQQTANMNAPNGGWVDVTQPPVITGPKKEVTLLATGQSCMFRLRQP